MFNFSDKFYFDFFHKYNFSGLNEEEKKKLYEDYKNKKKEFIDINCYGEFCADSGRVAVYDYSTLSEEDQKWIKEHDWCVCIIPDYTGEFHYAVEGGGNNRSAHIIGDGFYTTQSGFKKKLKKYVKFCFKMESNKKDSKRGRILFNDRKRGL